MLVLVSNPATGMPEETGLDFSFESDPVAQGFESVWFGHPLWLRGVLKDGTKVEIALSMMECVQIHAVMRDDAELQRWAEMMPVSGSGVANRAP